MGPYKREAGVGISVREEGVTMKAERERDVKLLCCWL